MEGMTNAEMANPRNRLARSYLPNRICKGNLFDESNCQYAYRNYKTKCLDVHGGLTCMKNHAHERDIVSDASNPYMSFLNPVLGQSAL